MNTLTLAQQADWLTRQIFGGAGANELARKSDAIFMWIFWFSLFWFVLLMGLMVYWVIKYRRRPGVPPQRSPHHNTPLELAWTILPSLFLGYMFYIGFQGYIAKLVAPTEALVYDVVGRKWGWTITYPNGGNPSESIQMGGNDAAPVVVVPVNTPVQFRMSSADVLHSFWIPDFRFKFDVLPNRYSSFWIEAEEIGEHVIFCAEYCGDKHSEMSALLRVVSREDYEAYLETTLAGRDDPVAWGRQLTVANGCVACHSVNGSPGIGPTWLNAWGSDVPFTDGTSLSGDDADGWDNYIRESIINPNAKIHTGYAPAMPPYAGVFSDEELGAIIAYMRSLSDKAPAPEEPEAEEEAPAAD